MESITGTIREISRAFNNGWRIARVDPHGTITGCLPDNLQPGDFCEFKGKWIEHPRYGKQFSAKYVKLETPRDIQGIKTYLKLHFPFIGEVIAGKLIEKFGDKLFDIIENDWQSLITIPGITLARAKEIYKTHLDIKTERDLDIFFATYNISLNLQGRLIEKYGSKRKAVEILKENPYRLADDIWGIGFKKADMIGLALGIKKESPHRIASGLKWILKEAAESEGHCFLPLGDFERRTLKILEVSKDALKEPFLKQVEAGHIVNENGKIYRSDIFECEKEVGSILKKLARSYHHQVAANISQDSLHEMDEDQKRALFLALNRKISIITGGPGTGKTYTVNKILEALGEKEIELAAPTGKAAKRMTELSGKPARTIHRLLEYDPFIGTFCRNNENPLRCDVLIIDESSMIDIYLMASLMNAIDVSRTQLIFVGDVNQLPSVGPGKVLSDMISSGLIPTAELKTLHRQAEQSLININAQRINRGDSLIFSTEPGSDFWFIPEENPERIAGQIIKAIKAIPKRFGFSFEDIQVLCPQKKGPVGIEFLNEKLRDVINPNGKKIPGTPFKLNDRVIQIRNNYSLGVFNGEIGHISGWDKKYLWVDFEGIGEVKYSVANTDEIKLAYALTIHKSQGSEFDVVIIPIHTTNYIMLKRNLLYTAITRGKKLVILVGTMKAINIAIRTIDSNVRYTNLAEILRQQSKSRIPEMV